MDKKQIMSLIHTQWEGVIGAGSLGRGGHYSMYMPRYFWKSWWFLHIFLISWWLKLGTITLICIIIVILTWSSSEGWRERWKDRSASPRFLPLLQLPALARSIGFMVNSCTLLAHIQPVPNYDRHHLPVLWKFIFKIHVQESKMFPPTKKNSLAWRDSNRLLIHLMLGINQS